MCRTSSMPRSSAGHDTSSASSRRSPLGSETSRRERMVDMVSDCVGESLEPHWIAAIDSATD